MSQNIEENEIINEKILLKNIKELLPCELINIIYQYLHGKSKFICYKKFDFIEIKIKNDFYKGYPFCNFIKSIIEPMDKPQLIKFITIGPIHQYPSIIERIWYLSTDTNIFYKGQNLIDLWSKKRLM